MASDKDRQANPPRHWRRQLAEAAAEAAQRARQREYEEAEKKHGRGRSCSESTADLEAAFGKAVEELEAKLFATFTTTDRSRNRSRSRSSRRKDNERGRSSLPQEPRVEGVPQVDGVPKVDPSPGLREAPGRQTAMSKEAVAEEAGDMASQAVGVHGDGIPKVDGVQQVDGGSIDSPLGEAIFCLHSNALDIMFLKRTLMAHPHQDNGVHESVKVLADKLMLNNNATSEFVFQAIRHATALRHR